VVVACQLALIELFWVICFSFTKINLLSPILSQAVYIDKVSLVLLLLDNFLIIIIFSLSRNSQWDSLFNITECSWKVRGGDLAEYMCYLARRIKNHKCQCDDVKCECRSGVELFHYIVKSKSGKVLFSMALLIFVFSVCGKWCACCRALSTSWILTGYSLTCTFFFVHFPAIRGKTGHQIYRFVPWKPFCIRLSKSREIGLVNNKQTNKCLPYLLWLACERILPSTLVPVLFKSKIRVCTVTQPTAWGYRRWM